MYYDLFAPFVRRSPFIRRTVTEIDPSQVYFPYQSNSVIEQSIDAMRQFAPYLDTHKPKVYLIQPLGLLVMDEAPLVVEYYRRFSRRIKAVQFEVDYTPVARNIEVDFSGQSNFLSASYLETNGYSVEDIVSQELITLASNGTSVSREQLDMNSVDCSPIFADLTKPIEADPNMAYPDITEADYSRYQQAGVSVPVTNQNPLSPAQQSLEAYLQSSSVTEKTPILLGLTAVAKSSTIKMLCDRNGYRLVDLRTAFMSRLDFEGLTEKIQVGDDVFSYNGPQSNLVECTDAFIMFCRAAVVKIQERIDTLQTEFEQIQGVDAAAAKVLADKIVEITGVLEKYKEKSKPVCLFFDEITRADASVRNALMKIVNEKKFLTYDMKMAKIVAATNYPVNLPINMQEVYHAALTSDVAFNDRFAPYRVTPESIYDSWIDWARGKPPTKPGAVHTEVVDYIDARTVEGVGPAYDYNDVIQKYDQTMDEDDLSTTPFPNYRTWEMVSGYLKRAEAEKTINPDVITGLIGVRIGTDFCQHLEQNGWTVDTPAPEQKLDRFVNDCIDGNVPTMLIGPSSIGKTTRLKEKARRMGIGDEEIIEINLALQDRVDVMGPPVKVPIVQHIGGHVFTMNDTGGVTSPVDQELAEELASLIPDFGLPEKVTIKAPKLDVASRFQNAMDAGKPIILFFDEMNRVNNEAIMSAVFEAISDYRIFGIDFSHYKDNVTVVAACNMGLTTEDAKSLDPAFAARFSMIRKMAYEQSDVDGMIKFMKERDYDPSIIGWIEAMAPDEALAMIQSVEERTLDVATGSMRSISDLNRQLKEKALVPFMYGSMLFADNLAQQYYMDVASNPQTSSQLADPTGTLKKLADSVNNKIDNWAAINTQYGANLGSEVVQVPELISDFKALYYEVFKNPQLSSIEREDHAMSLKALMTALFSVEFEVSKARTTAIDPLIGQYAEQFLSYYNAVSGTSTGHIDIADLTDIDKIGPFWHQELSALSQDELIAAATAAAEEFLNTHGDRLTPDHYQQFILESLLYPLTQDMKMRLVKNYVQPNTDPLIKLAEGGKSAFAKALFLAVGYPQAVLDDKIDSLKAAYAQSKTVAPSTSPKILNV